MSASRFCPVFMRTHVGYRGDGYFAGQAPDPADPESPDGRFRILNVPTRGRVMIYDRSNMHVVAGVLSNPDGTWRVDNLDRGRSYTVIGVDDRGIQNAAIQDHVVPAPMEDPDA